MMITYATLAGAALGALGLLAWRFSGTATTHGAARWLTVWETMQAGLFAPRGVLAGDYAGLLPVYYEDTHAITFGPAGSGKGVSAILPNLLRAPFVFLNDPGGENAAVAMRGWRKRRAPAYIINPFGMHTEDPWALPAHGFNPLAILDAGASSFAADTLLIAEMLTPRAGNESGSAAFFKDAGQSAIRAMLMHIVSEEPPDRRHLGTLYGYLNSDAPSWDGLLAAMQANPVCEGLVAKEANTLARRQEQAPEEFSAILSTAQQDISWLADPIVRASLRCNEVDFTALKGHGTGQRGGVVAVVLPLEYNESHAAIPRLALACALWTMQRGKLAREKVLFVIDEAAALGKVRRFPNWLATLRKYRAVLWPIFQNIGQVKALYGADWQTFIANCGLRQFLSFGDVETARYVEELLGKCTIRTQTTNGKGERSVSQAARSLLTAEELLHLPRTRQVTLIGNLKPQFLLKTPYWERPELRGTFYGNPYHGKTPRLPLGTRWRALRGRLHYAAAFWLTPHPLAALIYLASLSIAGYVLYSIHGAAP